MRPEAFLDVATDLAGASDAPRLRSAVSRAYYAVFHVATRTTASLGGPKRSGSHEILGERFQSSRDPEVSALGQRFLDLKAARHRADYQLRDSDDVEDPTSVSALVREARSLVEAFSALPRGGRREAAERAIEAYERTYRGR
jgi:uncharacterized protein (UPF0332 family)